MTDSKYPDYTCTCPVTIEGKKYWCAKGKHEELQDG